MRVYVHVNVTHTHTHTLRVYMYVIMALFTPVSLHLLVANIFPQFLQLLTKLTRR